MAPVVELADRESGPLILLGSLDPSPALDNLIEFLTWYAETRGTGFFRILSHHPGSGRETLEQLADVTVLNDDESRNPSNVLLKAKLNRAAQLARQVEARRLLGGGEPIYIADLGAARLLHWLGANHHSVTTHLLEFGDRLDQLPDEDRGILTALTTRWIVGSDAMADELARDLHLKRSAIAVHPDFVSLAHPTSEETAGRQNRRLAVREELAERFGFDAATPLVCSGAVIDWWRSPDSFVQVSWQTHLQRPDLDAHFLWIAGNSSERMVWPLHHEIHNAGLEGRVYVVHEHPFRMDCIAAADVYVATSRASETPVGVREAAAVGTPAVWLGPDGSPASMAAEIIARIEAGRDGSGRRVVSSGPDQWDVRVGGLRLLETLSE